MKNPVQIIKKTIYYKMEPVGFLNELNYSQAFIEFKQKLATIEEKCSVCTESDEAYENGYNSGRADGYEVGYADGYKEGATQ